MICRANQAPAVAKPIRVIAFNVKPLSAVDGALTRRCSSLDQQIDRLRAQEGCVESVEQDGPPATLGVADLLVKIASGPSCRADTSK